MAGSPSRRTSRRPEEGDVPVRTADAVDHVVSLLPTWAETVAIMAGFSF